MYLLSNAIPRYDATDRVANNCWHKMSSSCGIRHLLCDLKVKRNGEHHLFNVISEGWSDFSVSCDLLLAGRHIAALARGKIQQYADCRID